MAEARPPAPNLLGRLASLTPPPLPIRIAASVAGYVVTAAVVAVIYLNFPGFGHDAWIWDRVGDQVRAGISPYQGDLDQNLLFFYSPVWAVIFASVSWLPREVVLVGLMLLEILALRYCAGSWLRVGYLGLVPIIGFELSVGQINLIIAAAIAAALRGDGRLAVLATFAKLSPLPAIREFRRPLAVALLCIVATVPVLPLWVAWFDALSAASQALGPVPFPYVGRLAVAVALMLTGRTWARGLAVIVAIPNVTPNIYVLLVALMPVLPGPEEPRAAPSLSPPLPEPAIA